MNKMCALALDSKLAKAKVGKIIIDNERLVSALIKRSFERFDLVYVFGKMAPEVLQSFSGFDWVFPGIRIILHSKLGSINFPKFTLSPTDYFDSSDKRELQLLAESLFLQSRFYPDPHTHRLGKKIYTEWIKNSISGKTADTILVSRDTKGGIIGFISVKKNNNLFEPVLVKISDQYQGMGHGMKLMYKFFNYAASKDPHCSLMVNTMLHNTKALNFYHSFGLQVKDHQYVYHVYPKGFKKF